MITVAIIYLIMLVIISFYVGFFRLVIAFLKVGIQLIIFVMLLILAGLINLLIKHFTKKG